MRQKDILRQCPLSECAANHEGICSSEIIYGVAVPDCKQRPEDLVNGCTCCEAAPARDGDEHCTECAKLFEEGEKA